MTDTAVDLFAGPGGWDVAARSLGIDVIGIEWDDAAVATRLAAGLPTMHGDVRKWAPWNFKGRAGLIASPPCQTFSKAGKGAGREALDIVLQCIKVLEAREPIEVEFSDERTGLVLEPLVWALEAIDNDQAFEWLAFEQVPTVLPVWEAMADVLRREGYLVATGVLDSEQFGVPQTRRRAILVARQQCYDCLVGDTGYACECKPIELPKPTHRRYRKGVAQEDGDPSLLPWTSMADALGWDPGLVGFPRKADEGRPSVNINGTEYRERDFRATNEPAFAMTEKVRSWGRYIYRGGTGAKATRRPAFEPAPTLHFGARLNTVEWVTPEEAADSSVRGTQVSVAEASQLQTFPADYPWQGSRTKQFEQIGNAIPPMLAAAVLKEVCKDD